MKAEIEAIKNAGVTRSSTNSDNSVTNGIVFADDFPKDIADGYQYVVERGVVLTIANLRYNKDLFVFDINITFDREMNNHYINVYNVFNDLPMLDIHHPTYTRLDLDTNGIPD